MFPELYRHQEWADSIVWRAVMASDAAKNDKRVRDLLAHLHMTQQAFLTTWQQGVYKHVAPDDVLQYARSYHANIHSFIAGVEDGSLDRPMVMPWASMFKKGAVDTTMRETLMQVPMHSTYHRGQVNTRLRELGAEPPLVDYIAWLWFGKPAAEWP